jgi:repressor LexA
VEIARHFGFQSINAAEQHLRALARKGAIMLMPGTSRGIRLKQALGLPVVGLLAAAATSGAEHNLLGSCPVSGALFKPKADFLLRMQGPALRDAGILDGDLLAVQKAHEAREGQIVVARIGDEVTVKRFRRKAQHVELQPDNPEYRTIVVGPGETDFTLEGIAVGLIRNPLQL